MGRKKSQKDNGTPNVPKRTMKDFIADARKRLPSSRTATRCKGCFSPRNTLTAKYHYIDEKDPRTWSIDQLEILQEKKSIKLPCLFCGEVRILSLGSFSFDIFLADYESGDFARFALFKDDKFRSMVGFENFLSLGEILE